jgi:hypothetical protein
MPAPLDPRDCSRLSLEIIAEEVARRIAAGETHLMPWLDKVNAALADRPPEYDIDHNPRHRR